MADNTILNTGTGGDTIRDLARGAGTIKTQVVQLDLGGATANAEVLITAGQQVMTASVPVVIASNQTALPVTIATAPALVASSAIIGKVGIDQTTPGTTNLVATGAAVKAASTAALAADPALVVAISPNNSITTTISGVPSINLTQIAGTAAVTGGVAGILATGGPIAVNAASTGYPLYNGGIAVVGANPTKAANAQRTGLATDAIGRLITVHNHERNMVVTKVTQAGAATATVPIAISVAGVAGVFYDITSLTVTNTGTSPAGASFILYECPLASSASITTAGTIKGYYNIPTAGGITIPFATPKTMTTAGNTWYIVSPAPNAAATVTTSSTNVLNVTLEYVQNT